MRPGDPLPCQRRDPARQVDVLGQGRCPPAPDRGQQIASDHDPVATELGAAAHAQRPAVELAIERLLVRLRAGQPTAVRIENAATRRDGVGPCREVAGRTTQEPRLQACVGVENQDDVAVADIGLSRRQGSAFAIGQTLAAPQDHARYGRDAVLDRGER